MTPLNFRIACALRLGLPTTEFCPSTCGLCSFRRTDCFGIHPFSCQRNKPHLLPKHDAFCLTLKALASSANVRSQNRNLNIFQQLDENNNKRPDLLLHGMGTNGNKLYLDITIGDPRCQSYVQQARNKSGYTISRLTYNKNQRYKALCDRLGVSFLPVALEIFGQIAPPVLNLIKSLSARASEISSIPLAALHAYWIKRFSTVIQLGNAQFLLDSSSRMSSRQCSVPSSAPSAQHLLEDTHIASQYSL